eukprot:1148013-Pelagomonas_calceolata.AAC.4
MKDIMCEAWTRVCSLHYRGMRRCMLRCFGCYGACKRKECQRQAGQWLRLSSWRGQLPLDDRRRDAGCVILGVNENVAMLLGCLLS